ncbi:MAG: phospho-N-acetylmuramoyl-pentapeptide-transferase [Planctomycetes bacterium]|nr:phospho-N-acetylmuramoyl-pentapeptide-transferase [Planctomycetota bacterium]
MLYELLRSLQGTLPGATLVNYVSFRAAAAVLFAFGIAIFLGARFIPWVRRIGLGEDTSKTDSAQLAELHKGKKDTPTMGGLFLVGAMLIAGLLWMRFDGVHRYSLLGLFLVMWFGAVGLLDDWIKMRVPGAHGLSKRAKQGLLTVGAVAVGFLLTHFAGLEDQRGGPQLYFPFIKDASVDLTWALGIPFLLLAILVLTGSANAVNLTDGLDGLAIGCVAIATIALGFITYFVGDVRLSEYLRIVHVPGASEMSVLMGALLGASLGFLWYNAAPALVFMGDVGSLALGGALGYAALVSRTELVLLIVGGVFVAEALSVIVQVLSFKATGRRIFRCAPLHHHFQFGGVPESRLVVRIWVISALLALSSVAVFKVR